MAEARIENLAELVSAARGNTRAARHEPTLGGFVDRLVAAVGRRRGTGRARRARLDDDASQRRRASNSRS